MADEDSGHLVAELTRLGLAFLRREGFPTLKMAEAEFRAAIARAAFHAAGGNVTRAAALLGVGRATFRRAIRGSLMVRAGRLGQDDVMHQPFDDALFPFVRVLWPADPTQTWADEYIAWAMEAVIPRATQEGVRIVNLENWSAMEGIPGSALSQVKYLNDQMGPHAGAAGGGVIFYAPHVPIAGLLGPIINSVPVPLKIATSEDKVVKHATKLFQKANTPPPLSIHLD